MTSTQLPTVVYPTLTPTVDPTNPPGMLCEQKPIQIICQASDCTVRYAPGGGSENVAYRVPNKTILDGAAVCICPACAPLERNWFYLGRSGNQEFWAIQMEQVWEFYGD